MCENSPRFHQHVIKVPKSQGSMPPDSPSLLHTLHTDTYLPPNSPYNLILPTLSLGQKAERNPANCS